MQDGRIVEQGTHADLVRAQGAFATMVRDQQTDVAAEGEAETKGDEGAGEAARMRAGSLALGLPPPDVGEGADEGGDERKGVAGGRSAEQDEAEAVKQRAALAAARVAQEKRAKESSVRTGHAPGLGRA